MDNAIVASARHLDAPRIAANLAVLNEVAIDVRLNVDFQALAAKRTRDQELIWHLQPSYSNAWRRASVTRHVLLRALKRVSLAQGGERSAVPRHTPCVATAATAPFNAGTLTGTTANYVVPERRQAT
jgi:hypothetical protein